MSDRRQQGRRFPLDSRRMRLAAASGVALALIGGTAIAAVMVLRPAGPPPQPTAIIIDQLTKTDPDPDFIKDARSQLEIAGYHVDYVPPQSVTVDFYRDLPKWGYDFILIRSHSTNAARIDGAKEETIGLFTNEPYRRDRYVADQIALRLSQAYYPDDDQTRYFGIAADFVTGAMRGNLDGATVVLMGCGGLSGDNLARAFVDRGARVFLGWDGPVSAHYTDTATEELLAHLIGERLEARDAIAQTMAATGPDPVFGAKLALYP